MCLQSCATYGDAKTYFDPWADCVWKAAARLDDGRSDPVSVAIGISSACAPQFNAYREYMVGQNITQNGQAAARAMARDQEIRLATTAVLTHRAKNRPL